MTNERPDGQPRDADELTRQVAELGDTDEDRLEAVAERNASLEGRIPGDENLPHTKGDAADADGSPGQG